MPAPSSRARLLVSMLLSPCACTFPTQILVPDPPAAAAAGSSGPDASISCQPGTPPAWSPAWVPPAGASQDQCAAQDLANLYAACFGPDATSDACASAQNANPTCASCVLSASTDASWGAVVSFSSTTIINQPGCLALIEPSQTGCAEAAEAQIECEHAACDASCPVSDDPSYEAWEQCVAQADEGICAGYDGACLDVATSTDGGDAGGAACAGTDFGTAFMNVAMVFCGP